ncbi:MAG TPA: exosortase/archaeosortase family protein, partial [Opitutaceae bacterium]|nr:exosortase/archaeosortase family protein [Opitutaceae bacterium]
MNPAARLNAILLVLLAAALSVLLLPRWLHDPELAHGLFMPVIFVVLLREARRRGTPRYLPAGPAAAAAAALGFAALAALVLAGLFAAALGWRSSLAEFLLAASLAGFLGAGLALASRRAARWLPLNWASFLAAGLWILSAPFPPGAYARLTLRLQLWVSTGVMDALQILGVAAHRQGNIIELARGSVGIADACSGVRSLISCLYVALFFSATLVRRPSSRALVLVAAAPLALLMNFLRALLLTLLVDRGVEIEGAVHDLTGFAVLGFTALLLAGLAHGLERGAAEPRSSAPPAAPEKSPSRPDWVLSGGFGLAAALAILFALATHPNPAPSRPAPDLAALLPP